MHEGEGRGRGEWLLESYVDIGIQGFLLLLFPPMSELHVSKYSRIRGRARMYQHENPSPGSDRMV